MDEIIRIKNSSYGRYEELLLRRDSLQKEAFGWQTEYTAKFGDLILEVFQEKLECIRKKKTIEYCQAALNRGAAVDQDQLQAYLQEQMAMFRAQLDFMIKDTENAKNAKIITETDYLKIRKLYHKLVKLIHPDINPLTDETPELYELWTRVQSAYRCNNLEDLEETELLINAVLEKMGKGIMEFEIPDLDEKIEKIEREIVHIRETDPYTYKFILQDPKAVEEKNRELNDELRSYKEYSEQLENAIVGLLGKGMNIVWRMI